MNHKQRTVSVAADLLDLRRELVDVGAVDRVRAGFDLKCLGAWVGVALDDDAVLPERDDAAARVDERSLADQVEAEAPVPFDGDREARRREGGRR
jgi:hypothetical protein